MEFRDRLISLAREANVAKAAKEAAELEAFKKKMEKTPEERRWEEVKKIIGNLEEICLTAAKSGKSKAHVMHLQKFNDSFSVSDYAQAWDGKYWQTVGVRPWVLLVEEAIRNIGLEPSYENETDGLTYSEDYLVAKWGY